MKKKIILFALILGSLLMLWTPAMAKKELKDPLVTQNLSATLHPDSICFEWDPVEGAIKYSLEVDVDVDGNGDGLTDKVVKFSFGTGDRTDGGVPSDPDLCVLLEDFRSVNDYGIEERISGTAHVKVKALNPGKGNGRQNNAFSDVVNYSLPPLETTSEPETQCNDPLFCGGGGW